MVQENRYAFLDNMKAIAIVMVVAIHAMVFSESMPAQFKAHILVFITTIAVPVFFFIDGYLLALAYASGKKTSYLSLIKKSSYRLLVPWFIFSCGYLILRFIFEYFGLLDDKHVIGRDISYVVSGLYGSVYSGQMYFLLSLFLIRLISPLISYLFNKSPLIIAILLCVSFIILYGHVDREIYRALYIPGGQEPLTHAIWGVQFYIVGIAAFRVFSATDTKWCLPFSFLVFIASYLFHVPDFFQFAYLFFFFVFFKEVKFEYKWVSYLGKNTMGIYLLHLPLILKMTADLVAYVISDSLIAFFLNTFITTALTLLMVHIIRRLGLSHYLFGELRRRLA
jgi:fucose 4-O-acetylase-like acetyltransferase